MIQLSHISKSFDGGASWAVRDLNLDVREGETLVLLGSSGCGKTTTLKMINRLVEPTEGSISINGRSSADQSVTDLRRSIGYVFQGIGLFPNLRVSDNIEIVPRLLGWSRKQRTRRSHELLDLVGLPPAEFARRFPDELSGGQQQRVGVARALAADPDYLLMDEPFGALDSITREALQQEVIRLKDLLQKTIVLVTHDIFEALALADRIGVMNASRLEQVGSPQEILQQPATEFVRDLFAKPMKQLTLAQEQADG